MSKGINIAELIFDNHLLHAIYATKKRDGEICIFISHKDEDTEAAMALANHIMQHFGYNVYLDIYDCNLQRADNANDPEGVVTAIHSALKIASHLICIISEKSKGSWWIPYEIGYAKANDIKVSTIKTKQVEYLPTYLRVNNSPVFNTITELNHYLSESGPYGDLFSLGPQHDYSPQLTEWYNI